METSLIFPALLLAAGATLVIVIRSRRNAARRGYAEQLEAALADGILTPGEVEQLAAIRAQRDLSEDETRMAAIALYRRALRDAAADARFTDDEQKRLSQLQEQLGLSAADLSADREQLHRLWLLSRVERGSLPELTSPLALSLEERCHWVVRSSFCQRTGLPSSQRREASSITFRIDDDTPFEVGPERDDIGADPRYLPVDVGTIVLSSRRLIFRGAKRRVQFPYVLLQSVSLFGDAIRVVGSDGASAYLLVEDAELTAAILLRAARIRRIDVSGHTVRTA